MDNQGKGYGPVAFVIGLLFWALAFSWYGLISLFALMAV